jgi:DeoR family transcriptional regulator, fructose operon transcriptional repressor
MLAAERQTRLKDLISERGVVGLDILARELGVSQSTVRRDVESLEQTGLVRRTHGGVIWRAEQSEIRPYAFNQRVDFCASAKMAIARAAAKFVQPGQTVLIDGGTTTFSLAKELIGQSLQLVTNSLPIAQIFVDDDQVELILTGGLLYPRYGVMLGPLAEQMLSTVHTNTMFFSVAGIHDGHLYNQNLLLVESERRMMQQAKEVILLADSSKFGQQALSRLCNLAEVDIVVADSELKEEHRATIREAGCELVIAE